MSAHAGHPKHRHDWQALAAAAGAAALLVILVVVLARTLTPPPVPPVVPATVTPGVQVVPPGLRTPVPAIYKFFDWGTDYQKLHPEYGAIGAFHMILWNQINPAKGVYNWSTPDSWLRKEAALTVTLRSGEVCRGR